MEESLCNALSFEILVYTFKTSLLGRKLTKRVNTKMTTMTGPKERKKKLMTLGFVSVTLL